MFYSNIVIKAKHYIKDFLKDINFSNWYFYHNLEHTLEVFHRASYLSEKEWLNEEFQEIIYLACIFHDSGFVKQYQDNEYIWSQIAQKWLNEQWFQIDKIDIVKNLILYTNLSNKFLIPDSYILGSKSFWIIRDADLDNFWRDDFWIKNKQLFKEFNLKNWKITLNENQWLKNTEKIIVNYNFFTKTQIVERNDVLMQNKKQLKQKLQDIKIISSN